jgi:prefoldin alpha subunit
MSEEELNRLINEARTYQQQMQAVSNQLDTIISSSDEIRATIETLSNLKKMKNTALFPLGAGTYIKSEKPVIDTVLINIGAGIVEEKPVEEAKVLLEKRLKTMGEAITQGQRTMAELSAKLENADVRARRLATELNPNVRPAKKENL